MAILRDGDLAVGDGDDLEGDVDLRDAMQVICLDDLELLAERKMAVVVPALGWDPAYMPAAWWMQRPGKDIMEALKAGMFEYIPTGRKRG